MGMRNKRIYLFTICYDPVVSKVGNYSKTEVKLNSYSWPQKSYRDFEILVPIFLNLD